MVVQELRDLGAGRLGVIWRESDVLGRGSRLRRGRCDAGSWSSPESSGRSSTERIRWIRSSRLTGTSRPGS